MWAIYGLASKYSRLPSEIADPAGHWDTLTRHLVDRALTYFGLTIENALQETAEVGMGNDKHREPKYDLAELLDPDFRLPRPAPKAKAPKLTGLASLMALATQANSGVKLWQPIDPKAKLI